MDKSVAGFFLPIAVHIIGCIVNFRNLLWGHPTWVNVLVSTCCILFGFLFPLFARRWPFAVTVTAVLAGFLLLSCLLSPLLFQLTLSLGLSLLTVFFFLNLSRSFLEHSVQIGNLIRLGRDHRIQIFFLLLVFAFKIFQICQFLFTLCLQILDLLYSICIFLKLFPVIIMYLL